MKPIIIKSTGPFDIAHSMPRKYIGLPSTLLCNIESATYKSDKSNRNNFFFYHRVTQKYFSIEYFFDVLDFKFQL